MVVGDFGIVEHFFALFNLRCKHGGCEGRVWDHRFHNARHLGVNVFAEISGVNTRIGGHLFLVERLYGAQGHIGAITEFLVAFHLQAGEVEQAWWGFFPFLGLDVGHRQWSGFNAFNHLIGFFHAFVTPFL